MKKQVYRQLLFTLVLGISCLGSMMSANGQTSLLVPHYPSSYIVQDSDTLRDIASQFLRDPELWPQIWQPDDYLDNADLIYPGDTLKLSMLGGIPRIFVQRGGRELVKISPIIREEPLQRAIPAIALESIESSFTKNRIISSAEFESAPYIVSNIGDNLTLSTGDEIYARGSFPAGTRFFEIYHGGRTYTGDRISRKRMFGLLSTVEEEILGLEVEYLGLASITENIPQNMRKLLINSSIKEIQVGDRLLIREQSSIEATIFPTEPVAGMRGQIVAFLGAETLASQLDTVVIDLGVEDNLVIGDILSIQLAGTRITDEIERERMSFRGRLRTTFNKDRWPIPGERIGTLLVYKVFEKLSYGVVLSSTQPVELYNEVVSP